MLGFLLLALAVMTIFN